MILCCLLKSVSYPEGIERLERETGDDEARGSGGGEGEREQKGERKKDRERAERGENSVK